MKNVIGICNLHDCPHLGPLTQNRPLGTVTFLGRYALMDGALSNFTNSQIDKIYLLAKNNVNAVLNHVTDGHIWINNTKTGYLRILHNENAIQNYRFNTDVGNIISNLQVFDDRDIDYIIVTNPFLLAAMDFRKLVEAHRASGVDVTMVYSHINYADKEYLNCDKLTMDRDGKVIDVNENTGKEEDANISLETYIFTREAFHKILDSSKDISQLFSLRRLLNYMIKNQSLSINGQLYGKTVVPILSLDHYIKCSFKLLNASQRENIFTMDWPVYTTTHNTPPATYGPKSRVKNSFIANGCIIKGTVENCVISRDVVVEEGAVVKNSILFTATEVGKKVKLNYVLTDKQAKCVEEKDLSGKEDGFFFVHYGERV